MSSGSFLENIFDPAAGGRYSVGPADYVERPRDLYVFAFRVPQARGYTLVESGAQY